MSLVEHLENRKRACEEDLSYVRDTTPEYIDGLRRAIADYREAAEIHRAVWQGASSRI
jgi:hypothetical protein